MKKDKLSKSGDLKTSKKDKQKIKPQTLTMDMPEVKDIPGQEHIEVPQFREMQDVTISSADEEGEGILDDLNTDSEKIIDSASDVSRQEKKLLKKKGIKKDRGGEDLDTPGTELDNNEEDIGEEDEENNIYSQRD